MPGKDIEAEILSRKVPLCIECNATAPVKSKVKKSKKKAKGEWDSDVEDESDGPEFPPGIMKVIGPFVLTSGSYVACSTDLLSF